ncbi:Bromodomain-containing protein, partial [Favolaschia claudopus]
EIPYSSIVPSPMDLSTMRQKLTNDQYRNASEFHAGFKLMIWNCFASNSPGSTVSQAGVDLQRVFDREWEELP